VIGEFMPATDRAVFITGRGLHTEYVYTYGLPPGESSRIIHETYRDKFESVIEEDIPGPIDG
jgi:hypothetical protein